MKYYLITGLNNGETIKPYLLKGDQDLDAHLSCYGDCHREYWIFDTLKDANQKLSQLLKGL